jgi:hypothetical protein
VLQVLALQELWDQPPAREQRGRSRTCGAQPPVSRGQALELEPQGLVVRLCSPFHIVTPPTISANSGRIQVCLGNTPITRQKERGEYKRTGETRGKGTAGAALS